MAAEDERQQAAVTGRSAPAGAAPAPLPRPAKMSGHRMNTWPWMDSDQKCWQRAGSGVVLGVVVHGGVGEQPVLPVQQGRPGLVQHLRPAALRQDQPRSGQHPKDDHDGGGQQPLEQVQPVAEEAEGPPASAFRTKDRVSRKAEMSRKMSTPPGYPAQPHVVGHHHQDGERTEPLDLGPEGGFPAGRCLRPHRAGQPLFSQSTQMTPKNRLAKTSSLRTGAAQGQSDPAKAAHFTNYAGHYQGRERT